MIASVADLLDRAVPVVRTPEGLRALCKGKPASVEKYLASEFGGHLEEARAAMAELAAAHEPVDLHRRGFRLYERFWPEVPRGESGWGAMGELGFGEGAGRRQRLSGSPRGVTAAYTNVSPKSSRAAIQTARAMNLRFLRRSSARVEQARHTSAMVLAARPRIPPASSWCSSRSRGKNRPQAWQAISLPFSAS